MNADASDPLAKDTGVANSLWPAEPCAANPQDASAAGSPRARRACEWCGVALSGESSPSRRYCGAGCRSRASEARRTPVAPAPRRVEIDAVAIERQVEDVAREAGLRGAQGVMHVERLRVAMIRLAEIEAILDVDGVVATDRSGRPVPHPLIPARSALVREVLALWDRLLISPQARAKSHLAGLGGSALLAAIDADLDAAARGRP